MVAEAESESVQEELLKKLRDQTKITYHALERDLEKVKKEQPSDTEANAPELQEQTRIAETALGTDRRVKAIRFILAAKLFSAPYAKDYDVKELPLSDSSHKEIAAFILEREKAGERMRAHELFEILNEDDPELSAICDFNFEDKLTGETAERFFRDSVKTLEKEALEREIARLNEEFSAETDEQKRKAIGRKIMECVRKANQLKK